MAEPKDQVAPVEPQDDDDLAVNELSPEELEGASGGTNNCPNTNCPCQSSN